MTQNSDKSEEKAMNNAGEEPGVIARLHDLAANFPGREKSKKHNLFQLILAYYTKDEDFNTLKSIPTPKLVSTIYPPGDLTPDELKKHIATKRKNFSSLKSSLNKTLRTLVDGGLNPAGIVVSKFNVFALAAEKKEESGLPHPKSAEESLLDKLSKILSKDGTNLGGEAEKKIRTLLKRELSGRKKKVTTSEPTQADRSELLKRELNEKESEISRLNQAIDSLKSERETGVTQTDSQDASPKVTNGSPEPTLETGPETTPEFFEKLASVIKEGITKDLGKFKSNDDILKKTQNKLAEKEQDLLDSMEKLAEREVELLKENLRKKEKLEDDFKKVRESYDRKLSNLRSENQSIADEKERIISEKIALGESLAADEKVDAELEFKARQRLTEERKNIKKRVEELIHQEEKFHKEREFARKGFVVKEQNIQQMAADQMLQDMEISEKKGALENEKKAFREELEKKFDTDLKQLKGEFEEQKELLNTERKTLFQEKIRLEQERNALEEKENALSDLLREKLRKETEKKNAEIEKRERELEERIKKIANEEELLQQDKKNIIEQMSAGLGGKTSLLKLKELVKNQESLMARKQSLMESEESLRDRVYKSLKSKSHEMQKEIAEEKEELKQRAAQLQKQKKLQDERESQIIEEKNRAITEYRNKYDELIKRREEEFKKKEEEYAQKIENLNSEEAELLAKKEALLKRESDSLNSASETNDEAAKIFEENLQSKKLLLQKEEEIIKESAALNALFKNRFSDLKKRYKKKFDDLSGAQAQTVEKEDEAASEISETPPEPPLHDENRDAFDQKLMEEKEELLRNSFEKLEEQKEAISKLKDEASSLSAKREKSLIDDEEDIEKSINEKVNSFLTKLFSGSDGKKLADISVDDLLTQNENVPTAGDNLKSKTSHSEEHQVLSGEGKTREGEASLNDQFENMRQILQSLSDNTDGVSGDSSLEGKISQIKEQVDEISKQLAEHPGDPNSGAEQPSSEADPGTGTQTTLDEKSALPLPTEAGLSEGEGKPSEGIGEIDSEPNQDIDDKGEVRDSNGAAAGGREQDHGQPNIPGETGEASEELPGENGQGRSASDEEKTSENSGQDSGAPRGGGKEVGRDSSDGSGGKRETSPLKDDDKSTQQESADERDADSAETDTALDREKEHFPGYGEQADPASFAPHQNDQGNAEADPSGTEGELPSDGGGKGGDKTEENSSDESGGNRDTSSVKAGSLSKHEESPAECDTDSGETDTELKPKKEIKPGEEKKEDSASFAPPEDERSSTKAAHSGAENGNSSSYDGESGKGVNLGTANSEEMKLSTESGKDGAPITFGEENILNKTTAEELESQIVKFNGNVEEFANSAAFLKAIAQKYNVACKVPPGEFELGCNGSPESSPRHKISIDTGFTMSKFAVTNLQFLQFVKETGYITSVEKKLVTPISTRGGKRKIFDKKNKVIGYEDKNVSFVIDNSASFRTPFGRESNIADKYGHPVTQVTWYDAIAYCEWLSQHTGREYRLPTEAEWEYAATGGGTITPDFFSSELSEQLPQTSNFLESLVADTTPVDFFPDTVSAGGVCDLLGNVWEWTQDPFAPYPGNKKTDSLKDTFKVARGYGFTDPRSKANFWIRRPAKPMTAASYIGFRVVCLDVEHTPAGS